jgi:hypothetical protein
MDRIVPVHNGEVTLASHRAVGLHGGLQGLATLHGPSAGMKERSREGILRPVESLSTRATDRMRCPTIFPRACQSLGGPGGAYVVVTHDDGLGSSEEPASPDQLGCVDQRDS